MSACREVSTWITENVLIPVEKFITEAKEVCENIGQWVDQQVSQPIEEWVSQQERHCREQECKWWCACCNKWFCWIVTVVVKVVTWVVVTVTKWVVTLVCHIVTTVIGIVVELVLKVIHRLVTFFVCLFTDPLQALKTLWDLWNDIVDTIDDIFDFVITIINDIKGIIHDIGRLIASLGRSFCIFGDAACAFFTAIFGFIKGIIDWLEDIVDWVSGTVEGIKELIGGILTLNFCRIQLAMGIGNVFRVIGSVLRIPAGWFYSGPKSLVDVATLDKIINDALTAAFSGDPERLARSKKRARLGGSPTGLPLTIDARRIAIRSTEFLRTLHTTGVLNLHALAGRVSDCDGKFIYNAFAGEVVYTGTSTAVSQSDLDDFIKLGPDAVPSFTAYPIKLPVFRRNLDMAKKKGLQIGLNFTWQPIKEIVISSDRFIPLQSDDATLGTVAQQELLRLMGRPYTGEDLSIVPSIAVFSFARTSLHGLTAWFRPPRDLSPSGTTFRSRFPEVAFRFVPIHEIGHYYGINHTGHPNPSMIMWSPQGAEANVPDAIPELLFLSGEANFIEQDARDVWNYITTTDQARDTILP